MGESIQLHAWEIKGEEEKRNCGLSFLRNRWCICESLPWFLSRLLVSKELKPRIIQKENKTGTDTK